jgi:hypothetical protein
MVRFWPWPRLPAEKKVHSLRKTNGGAASAKPHSRCLLKKNSIGVFTERPHWANKNGRN